MHFTGEMKPAFKFLFFLICPPLRTRNISASLRKRTSPAQKAGCECESRCGGRLLEAEGCQRVYEQSRGLKHHFKTAPSQYGSTTAKTPQLECLFFGSN